MLRSVVSAVAASMMLVQYNSDVPISLVCSVSPPTVQTTASMEPRPSGDFECLPSGRCQLVTCFLNLHSEHPSSSAKLLRYRYRVGREAENARTRAVPVWFWQAQGVNEVEWLVSGFVQTVEAALARVGGILLDAGEEIEGGAGAVRLAQTRPPPDSTSSTCFTLNSIQSTFSHPRFGRMCTAMPSG